LPILVAGVGYLLLATARVAVMPERPRPLAHGARAQAAGWLVATAAGKLLGPCWP
jgi:hypothetical protein